MLRQEFTDKDIYLQTLNRLAATSLNHRGSGGLSDHICLDVTDKAWLIEIGAGDAELDWSIYDNEGCHRLSGTIHRVWQNDLREDLFTISWHFECIYNILLTAQD